MHHNEKIYTYDAVISSSSIGIGGAYVPFPYDIRSEFGAGRAKVHVTFDGEPYDGSIVNMGVKNADGSICYIIGIKKKIRAKIGKQPGDSVRVVVTAGAGPKVELKRCPWMTDENPLYLDYHDKEWGRPVHDDRTLFEMLILEGAQAGLSWLTVLKKREAYRKAFDDFDLAKIALYDDKKVEELMANEGIVRNRLKIKGAITNAKLVLEIIEKHGSFDKFIWDYVDNTPIIGHWENIEDMPLNTPLSDRISKDLKKMGFKFIGTTIIYSFMQAVGMVNDHTKDCFVYKELTKGRK